MAAGTQLLRRACVDEHVLHIDSGRVALGVVENGALAHQMGLVEGPAWLNVGCAVLDKPPVVDAVADGPVQLRRVPLRDFVAGLRELPAPALALLRDMAAAHRQQAELAVSRLAKDAEARCAEWLLRHAEPAQGAPGTLAVMLRQRKRMIAAQLGIAPETLSRVLRQLRERSLISGTGRILNLLDPGALRALAGA
ncbi:MAG TPA: Crp/Fnr family transcriptional regulator [Ottowia sp.]|nr:Crp/Fnr family transcriptional regulator [Pseudomonadota bacterium]HMT17526.1 Crp/Fnr family transcriptional regulator [Ottowia sp.]HMT56384.1 Crp/Fnr family transcriptional regulator [Ottowia sp.]HMT64479.1 Crp/Fnr family transcriptional regulator [Ottowia sp.]